MPSWASGIPFVIFPPATGPVPNLLRCVTINVLLFLLYSPANLFHKWNQHENIFFLQMSRFFLFKLIAFFSSVILSFWLVLKDVILCISLSVQEGWLRFFVEGPFKLVAPLSDLSGGAALWLPSKGGGDNPATCAAHDVLLLPSDSLPLLLFCCNLILPCCSSYSPIYCVGCMYNVRRTCWWRLPRGKL